MRNDMYKVVHEQARSNGRTCSVRAPRQVDGDDLRPVRESMRSQHRLRFGGKQTRLNLAPLRRFLASRVGLPWDQVYAELRQGLRQRDHALDDPMRYLDVAVSTSMQNGEVVAHTSYSGLQALDSDYGAVAYYVHPESHTLCANKLTQSRRRRAKEERAQRDAQRDANRRVLGPMLQLHFHRGQWYEVKLGEMPTPAELKTLRAADWLTRWKLDAKLERFDVLLGRRIYNVIDEFVLREQYGHPTHFAQAKRQLSHKELKFHGLLPAAAV